MLRILGPHPGSCREELWHQLVMSVRDSVKEDERRRGLQATDFRSKI